MLGLLKRKNAEVIPPPELRKFMIATLGDNIDCDGLYFDQQMGCFNFIRVELDGTTTIGQVWFAGIINIEHDSGITLEEFNAAREARLEFNQALIEMRKKTLEEAATATNEDLKLFENDPACA